MIIIPVCERGVVDKNEMDMMTHVGVRWGRVCLIGMIERLHWNLFIIYC